MEKSNIPDQSQEQQKPPITKIPTVDEYVIPLHREDIPIVKEKIDKVLNQIKITFDSSDSLQIVPEVSDLSKISVNSQPLGSIKPDYSELGVKKHALIIDSKSFLHFKEENPPVSEGETEVSLKTVAKKLDSEILRKLLISLKEKGVLVLVIDFHFLKQISESLNSVIQSEFQSLVSLFVKLYVIERTPLVSLLYIQKSESVNKLDFNSLKLLNYEYYSEDGTITKPVSYLVSQIPRSITYMYEMYQFQAYLSTLRPGNVVKIPVKENFWSENVDYTLTIVDSNEEDLLRLNTCVAVIVTKTYMNDFIYISQEGNLQLCRQVQASRLILIRPNSFNSADINTIKEKISHYILLFKFRFCVSEQIPIMLMSDSKAENYEIYKDNSMMIRDVVENDKKETFRQLIFLSNEQEIQSEVKLLLTSKAKVKSHPDEYIPLPTIDKYNEKNLKSCLDDSFICSFYIKTLLSGLFFLDTSTFPEKKMEILILGAGIGTVNHFFTKILRHNCNITAVEIDKNIVQLGEKYFGFKNSSPNVKWVFMDAKEFLEKQAKDESCRDKYDVVVIDINNTNPTDGISPPPVFFDNGLLENIKTVMKESGLYIINLMARSFQNYHKALTTLEEVFPLLFLVENNEDLNKIHFCFKKKLSNQDYLNKYKDNLEKFKEQADISLIENDYKKVLSRVVDTGDLKNDLKNKLK